MSIKNKLQKYKNTECKIYKDRRNSVINDDISINSLSRI